VHSFPKITHKPITTQFIVSRDMMSTIGSTEESEVFMSMIKKYAQDYD